MHRIFFEFLQVLTEDEITGAPSTLQVLRIEQNNSSSSSSSSATSSVVATTSSRRTSLMTTRYQHKSKHSHLNLKKPSSSYKSYKRSKLHQVKRQEYKNLRNMVPALKEKNKVSKVSRNFLEICCRLKKID